MEGQPAPARITALLLSTVTASPGGEPPASTAIQEEMGCHHLGAAGGRHRTLSQIRWRGKAAAPPLGKATLAPSQQGPGQEDEVMAARWL